MTAALTPLPVLGVPVESKALSGQDSLLSIVQMPAGIPVGTLAIGEPAPSTQPCSPPPFWRSPMTALAERLDAWRAEQTRSFAERPTTRR